MVKKYIDYDNKTNRFFEVTGSNNRPTNQRDAIPRIITRLNRLKDQGVELEAVQSKFLLISQNGKPDLSGNRIEIAHNISIGYFKKEFAHLLNNRQSIDVSKGDEFAEEILSTDDDEKQLFHNFIFDVKNIELTSITIDRILNYVNAFLFKLNKASRNLMPGHQSPNRSIQENRDPHTIKRGEGHEETEISKRISEKTNRFFLNNIVPKSRNQAEALEHQSSSIHEDHELSWFKPRDEKQNSYQTCLTLFPNLQLNSLKASSDEEGTDCSADDEQSDVSDSDSYDFSSSNVDYSADDEESDNSDNDSIYSDIDDELDTSWLDGSSTQFDSESDDDNASQNPNSESSENESNEGDSETTLCEEPNYYSDSTLYESETEQNVTLRKKSFK
jgi:hypothetical protein